MNNKFYYPAILQKEADGYSIWLYDINGCVSQGDNFQEAIENINGAMGLFFEDFYDNNLDIPKATEPDKIKLEDNQTIAIVEFDWIAYQTKYNNKSVKKTLTIPAWLNTMAETQHINFSSVLQTALKETLKIM